MAIQDCFNNMEDTCEPVTYVEGKDGNPEMQYSNVLFSWAAKGVGFGQLHFYFKENDEGIKVLRCDNECMSKEFIKRMLCKMVDDAIMNDPNSKDKE